MIKLIKKTFSIATMLIVCIATLVSCSNSDKANTRYVAAKLVDSDLWSIVDVTTGEIIHKDEFKSQPTVIVNDKFCVKNGNGSYDYFSVNNVTKPINGESYLYATAFNENDIALAVLKGKGISVINGKCEVVANLDNSIVSANDFENGFAAVSNDDNKYGYINENGEIVIKPSYDRAFNFSTDGLAIVGKGVNDSTNKYFAIDNKGNELFSFSSNEYKDFGSFNHGFLPAQKENGEVVLLDKTGKKVSSIGKWKGYIPDWLEFNNGVIVFMDGDAYGLKNEKGEIVIRAKYDELIPLTKINDKYYLAKKQEKYGVVDKNDNVIIPFDYTVLGYINKNTLIVGEGKSFNFMNKELKDVGQNNYTNLSFLTGSSIYSNHFNAEKEARKIISNITDTTFFKTRKGMILRDFKDKLSGYKYADMDKSTLRDYDYPFSFLYGFDKNLSSRRYNYIHGYSFPTSPEYNYNANLSAVFAINSTFEKFQPGSEEALAKAFDSQIQKVGFKPVEGKANWFKNDKDMAVALAYDKGKVTVMCVYLPRYMELTVERKPREESSKDDVQVDYVDTFGFEELKESTVVEDVIEN
ncbi:MAG: WG repeat-containing protein [Paramuribaculum sp.]|nr:WG repeat-containing protein [Paramuribaculum sp.]